MVKVQRFKATGVPQPGGVFSLSVYGYPINHTWIAGDTLVSVIADLTSQINTLNIAVAGGDQPPTNVTAAVNGSDTTIIEITLDTSHTVTGSYTPTTQGTADVVLSFTEPATPGISYTVKVHNVEEGTDEFTYGATSPITVTVNRGFTYDFSIRTNCTIGSSAYVLDIQRFIP